MVNVERVSVVDKPLLSAVEVLIPQLSARLSIPSELELRRLVASPTTALFCAYIDQTIVGMLTLAWYDAPSGRHAWIEDVVCDSVCRGRGVGRALVEAGLECAAQIGADKVSLTSHASRTAAHALYVSEGFELYDTTVFRRKIER